MASGIYRIECVQTGKYYICSAVNIRQRFNSHLYMLRHGKHGNRHLQNAWNKYGECSFFLSVIEECEKDTLIAREQHWIDATMAFMPAIGMNNSPTATTSKGFRHSEATKERLSELARARDNSHLSINSEKMRGTAPHNKGKPGRKWTDDEKARASAQKKGHPAWNKGIPHTEAAKEKISTSLSVRLTRYGDDVAVEIMRLRATGLSWPAISRATGVSLSQCNKIGRGMRKFDALSAFRTLEKVKGVAR